MQKSICSSKLNSLLADAKASVALATVQSEDVVAEDTRLSKISLRSEFARHPAGTPFYAFVKRSGDLYGVIDLKSGAIIVVGNDNIASLTNVKGNFEVDGICYGLPSTGNANGVLYNKAVFEAAGVTELPKTPDEFIAALQAVKDNTDAIPLYTNYAAGWTMGAWDSYVGVASNGDPTYMQQVLPHAKDPFAKQADEGTGPYAVYKILYDAAAEKLIEEDYTTTDWEGCKGMMNRGEIGTMVLGSWAYTQMQEAGDKPEDIGYMAFPITVDGKQYAPAGGDYNFGINVQATDDEKLASLYYLKWLTHESGFTFAEGGVPIDKNGEYPDLYAAFAGIDMLADEPALDGEATLLNEMNSESELNINAGGNTKVQEIVEHGFNGTKDFDEIMADWNEAWSDAQATLNVTVNE